MNIKEALKAAIDGETAIDVDGHEIIWDGRTFTHEGKLVDFSYVGDEGWSIKKKPWHLVLELWSPTQCPAELKELYHHESSTYKYPFTITINEGHNS